MTTSDPCCDACGGQITGRGVLHDGMVLCSDVCSTFVARGYTTASAQKIIGKKLVAHGTSKRRFRFTLEQERAICDAYSSDAAVTMPQIARKWNTSRQIIRGVLQRNRVAIRRWCIRPPVQKVRVAFAHASPVRLAVQDAVGAPGDSAAVTPDRAEPYGDGGRQYGAW